MHRLAGRAIEHDARDTARASICRPSSTSTRATTAGPSGPVWCVTSVMPSISLRERLGLVGRLRELDAAALAAAAGVDLRLDDDDAAAEALGDRRRPRRR